MLATRQDFMIVADQLSKDYEYAVQSSETMIDIAGIRLMLKRLVRT